MQYQDQLSKTSEAASEFSNQSFFCFVAKIVSIFAKSSIVYVRLGSEYVPVLPLAKFYRMSTNRSTNTFFVKVSDKDCYRVILTQ